MPVTTRGNVVIWKVLYDQMSKTQRYSVYCHMIKQKSYIYIYLIKNNNYFVIAANLVLLNQKGSKLDLMIHYYFYHHPHVNKCCTTTCIWCKVWHVTQLG